MEEYTELAAACLGLPLSTQAETVEEKLSDQWRVDISSFAEIADALLVKTRPFPSELVEGVHLRQLQQHTRQKPGPHGPR